MASVDSGARKTRLNPWRSRSFSSRKERGRAIRVAPGLAASTAGAKLLRRLCLPRGRGFLLPRGRTIAFLEAGAAAGVAPLDERRREIIAAAVAADELIALTPDRCVRWRGFLPALVGATFLVSMTAGFDSALMGDLLLGRRFQVAPPVGTHIARLRRRGKVIVIFLGDGQAKRGRRFIGYLR